MIGFFGVIEGGGHVYDVTLNQFIINGDEDVGVLAGKVEGDAKVEDITITSSTIFGKGEDTGTDDDKEVCVGGVAGRVTDESVALGFFKSINVEVTINTYENDYGINYGFGGAVGCNDGQSLDGLTVSANLNLPYKSKVGGGVGDVERVGGPDS